MTGSNGDVLVDKEGTPIEYRYYSGALRTSAAQLDDEADYHIITRVNVKEWHEAWPGEDLLNAAHDILDFGYWYTKDGKDDYESAAEDWRQDFRNDRRVVLKL